MATEILPSSGRGSETAVAVMLPPSIPSIPSIPSQPSQPSLAGSLGKRKRGQESAAGSVGAVTSASYGFALSVKERVEQFNGGFQCWHCGAPKSHICHVIGRRERVLFQELKFQGRLGIQHPDQAENAIPLCPLCHDALDEISSPGWVFIPTDLQYFLDVERRDYKRRREMLDSTGAYTVRVCPSAHHYLQHRRKELEEDACGGLYACYVLRHYMGRMPGLAQLQPGPSPYTEPKPWHGDPMAALSKAFKAVGMTPLAFPAEMRDKLMELSILYGTNDQLLKVQPRRQSATDSEDETCFSPRQRTPSSPRRQRGTLDGQRAHSTTLKRKRSSGEAHENMNTSPRDGPDRRKRPIPEARWKWGPGATSEKAIEFYDSIYHIPQKETTTSLEAKEPSDEAPQESLLPSPISSERNRSIDRSRILHSQQTKRPPFLTAQPNTSGPSVCSTLL